MKKFIVIIVVLFSFILCSVASIATPGKAKIIGKPFNKNWKVKMGKNSAGGNNIVFADDGKNFYPIFDQDGIGDVTMIWSPGSPGGKYLMVAWEWEGQNPPVLEDGFWRYTPDIYDPTKHVVFSGPTKLFPGYLLMSANWVKGSKSDLNVEFVRENDDRKTQKMSIEEWEKNSPKVEVEPYLQWLGWQIVDRLKKNQIKSIGPLVKGAPEEQTNSAIRYLLENFKIQRIASFRVMEIGEEGRIVEKGEKTFWVVAILRGGGAITISITAKIAPDFYPRITGFSASQECGQ